MVFSSTIDARKVGHDNAGVMKTSERAESVRRNINEVNKKGE